MPMVVTVLPPLMLPFAAIIFFAGGLQQQFSLDRIVHHGIVRRLFLLLYRQHRVFSDLRGGISSSVCVL